MKTTTSTKPTDEGALRKRDPKTGRFEKTTAKVSTTAKPAAAKATKPAAPKAKKA